MQQVLTFRRVETRNFSPNGDKVKIDDPNKPTLITLDIQQRELRYASGVTVEFYSDIDVVDQSVTWSRTTEGDNTRLSYKLFLNHPYRVEKYRGDSMFYYGEELYELCQ